MEGPYFILSSDAFTRTVSAVRWTEGQRRGTGRGEPPPPSPRHSTVYVVPTGPPVPIASIAPNPPVALTVPGPAVAVAYPGRYVYRELARPSHTNWYVPIGGSCWIVERNNQGLWLGRKYEGLPSGQIGGVGVVTVHSAADPQKLVVVGSNPECRIAGVDYWPAAVLMWDVEAGSETDENVADEEVLVFAPGNPGFAYGDEVWAKLVGPVVVPPYGASVVTGSYPAPQASTAFEMLTAGGGGGPGPPGTCTLPESATWLAEHADKDKSAEDNLADWTDGLGHLRITLSAECCYEPKVERFCADDGTHIISKRRVTYHSNPIKVAVGQPVDALTIPSSWDQLSAHACADMADE